MIDQDKASICKVLGVEVGERFSAARYKDAYIENDGGRRGRT